MFHSYRNASDPYGVIYLYDVMIMYFAGMGWGPENFMECKLMGMKLWGGWRIGKSTGTEYRKFMKMGWNGDNFYRVTVQSAC